MVLAAQLTFTTSCKKDEDTPEPSTGSNAPADAPLSLLGTTADMEFTTANTGAPYTLNQQVKMSFVTNGDLGIDDDPTANDGDELTLSFTSKQGNEYVWTDNANGHIYSMSLIDDTTINEINVFDISGVSFLGQFTPINNNTGNIVANYEGSYTVTNVLNGSHTRMSVSIDADGNIDFDTNVMLDAGNFALVSDRLDCCDGIWIDMDPFPTTNYPRAELYVDSTSGDLNALHYYPDYPSISGRVQVELSN